MAALVKRVSRARIQPAAAIEVLAAAHLAVVAEVTLTMGEATALVSVPRAYHDAARHDSVEVPVTELNGLTSVGPATSLAHEEEERKMIELVFWVMMHLAFEVVMKLAWTAMEEAAVIWMELAGMEAVAPAATETVVAANAMVGVAEVIKAAAALEGARLPN